MKKWDFECLTQMARALLACPSMKNRHKRQSLVEQLSFGHQIDRDDTDLHDVLNIVTTCSQHKKGLSELFRWIGFFEENSHPYNRVIQVKLNVFLYQICVNLPIQYLQQAYYQSLPQHAERNPISWDEGDEFQSRKTHPLWAVLDDLWEFGIQNDQSHPLLMLAEYLRKQDNALAKPLKIWQQLVAKQLGIDKTVVDNLQTLTKPTSEGNPLYLQLILHPDPDNMNRSQETDHRYFVQLWLWQGELLIEGLHEDQQALHYLADLPELLRTKLAKINKRYPRQPTPLTLEFFLPRTLLHHKVEDEEFPVVRTITRVLREHYKVVVRFWERFEFSILHDHWGRRWSTFKRQACTPQRDKLACLCKPTTTSWRKFFEQLSEQKNCLGVLFVPPKMESKDDFFNEMMNAGVPVAVWPRQMPTNQADLLKAIQPLLKHQQLADLPTVLYEERKQAKAKHLTLLWDNFDRIPRPDPM